MPQTSSIEGASLHHHICKAYRLTLTILKSVSYTQTQCSLTVVYQDTLTLIDSHSLILIKLHSTLSSSLVHLTWGSIQCPLIKKSLIPQKDVYLWSPDLSVKQQHVHLCHQSRQHICLPRGASAALCVSQVILTLFSPVFALAIGFIMALAFSSAGQLRLGTTIQWCRVVTVATSSAVFPSSPSASLASLHNFQ